MGFKSAETVIFVCLFVTPFSIDVNTSPARFQMEYVDLQSKI